MQIKKYFNAKGLFLILGFVNFISFFTFSFYLALGIVTLAKFITGKYALGIIVFTVQIVLTILSHLIAQFYYSKAKNKQIFFLIYGLLALILFLLSLSLFIKTPFSKF